MYGIGPFLALREISGIWITPQAALMIFILTKIQGTFIFT